tara:strand:+ start:231 stop:395 length:165 start_codon:yes stop_codon:yes gene_type:complete
MRGTLGYLILLQIGFTKLIIFQLLLGGSYPSVSPLPLYNKGGFLSVALSILIKK